MFGFNRIVSVLILLGIVVISGWSGYKNASEKSLINAGPVVVEIPKGASFNNIVSILQTHHVEIQPFWFKLIAYRHNLADKIQAGEYELNPGLTSLQLLYQFAGGKVKQYSVTFPEGWCFKEMLKLLANNPNLQHLLDINNDPEMLSKQLGIDKAHPEGWFFPDTYYFTKHTSDIALLKKAHLKMQAVLDSEWRLKQMNLPIQNTYQALILASIIEKETGLAGEREKIAGVFVRRLQKRIPLQTDPTVIYGMGTNYQGDIRSKDLKMPTPYNTYLIPGLPPTPIAMPGLKAIHAALHPGTGESLYFVAKGDGSHVFSVTLEEHNKAVNNYLNYRAHAGFNLQEHSESVTDYD